MHLIVTRYRTRLKATHPSEHIGCNDQGLLRTRVCVKSDFVFLHQLIDYIKKKIE